ncbi:MAG: hypothetical protein VYC86_07390 [Pseudomonadota bacterium]|nr:hypothetical protein [Pseudomonadota bacterium]
MTLVSVRGLYGLCERYRLEKGAYGHPFFVPFFCGQEAIRRHDAEQQTLVRKNMDDSTGL